MSLWFLLGQMHGNGYVYGVVWRFEARTCQTVTKFIRCNDLEISTIRQMHYTRCCVFVLYSSQSVSVMGQPYSLTSFGLCVNILSDLAMCMDAKGGHQLSFSIIITSVITSYFLGNLVESPFL